MYPSGFASCGSTTSIISVREALTGRPGDGLSAGRFGFWTDDFMAGSSRPRARQFGVPGRGGYNTRIVPVTQPQKKTRREMLEEFAAAHPNDAFAR